MVFVVSLKIIGSLEVLNFVMGRVLRGIIVKVWLGYTGKGIDTKINEW